MKDSYRDRRKKRKIIRIAHNLYSKTGIIEEVAKRMCTTPEKIKGYLMIPTDWFPSFDSPDYPHPEPDPELLRQAEELALETEKRKLKRTLGWD